jgi:hypothetical protein
MKYIIYKITIQDYIYVGSTKNFTHRKSQHKSECNLKKDRLIYNKINELGGWENSVMTPIHECDCETNIQAHIQEELFRKECNANLNSKQCHTTDEENKNYKKEYRIHHSDEIKEKGKEYYQLNLDKRLEYCELNKDKISKEAKEYRKINKDKIKEYKIAYCEANREQINARKRDSYAAKKKNNTV